METELRDVHLERKNIPIRKNQRDAAGKEAFVEVVPRSVVSVMEP